LCGAGAPPAGRRRERWPDEVGLDTRIIVSPSS
jgi:hypothetical protein